MTTQITIDAFLGTQLRDEAIARVAAPLSWQDRKVAVA